MIYDKAIAATEERLRAVIGTERPRRVVATLLVLACNFGAGDALAGSLLMKVPRASLEQIAVMLCLDDYKVRGGGEMQAMLLLGAKSSNETVAMLLKELDAAASSGRGWML